MSKSDLVNFIAEDAGMTKADAARALESMMKGIEAGLKESGKVTITSEKTDTYIKFIVKDDGIGIPKEKLDKIELEKLKEVY